MLYVDLSVFGVSEPRTKQATIFSCICETYGQGMFSEVKVIRKLMWHSI